MTGNSCCRSGTLYPTKKSSLVVKHSVVIAGHKTSISVEDAFWNSLKEIARDRDTKLYDLVAVIDSKRKHSNLSSAIRLFVLDHYRRQAVPLLRN
jgi:predicted DNA-binding ribbon-helix-helix protein